MLGVQLLAPFQGFENIAIFCPRPLQAGLSADAPLGLQPAQEET